MSTPSAAAPSSPVPVLSLGWPRIGPERELKRALEDHWSGRLDADGLAAAGRQVRRRAWLTQAAAGVRQVPLDFCWYDPLLATLCALGAVPARFRAAGLHAAGAPVSLECQFALARGSVARDLPALDMTKWFDTNYHHLVPELARDLPWRADAGHWTAQIREALADGHDPRPVLVGPLTFLRLARVVEDGLDPLELLPTVLGLYARLLADLHAAGAAWVQVDEPAAGLDLEPRWQEAFKHAWRTLGAAAGRPKILLSNPHGGWGPLLDGAASLPVEALHHDCVRGGWDEAAALAARFAGLLCLGVVDGRNIWRTDLDALLERLEPLHAARPGRLALAPSCTLAHVPHSLRGEVGLDPVLLGSLAFAEEKLAELGVLARGLAEGRAAVATERAAARQALERRRRDPRTRRPQVRAALAAWPQGSGHRPTPRDQRLALQRARLRLPPLPTTTIGSFPQTDAIRRARADFRAGRLSATEWRLFLCREIRACIDKQERLGLDVLVHGEAERTDMVEYFGQELEGFAFTGNGWVQSYGSRCVKPPILFGDVARRGPITVDWAAYAQSCSAKPVKGMLTGPVTILQWSFVRDDQPRGESCRQVALALREEVRDLEAAGIGIIQVDEPAVREGLPPRAAEQAAYLAWAVDCFRLATGGVRDATQIHTHLCYSEFGEIFPAITALDADVLSVEAARSGMALVEAFAAYPADLGPGVWDIHSPRVPAAAEIAGLLRRALAGVPAERLWVNPDCGLKTRGWPETEASLKNLVEAARQLRAELRSGLHAAPADEDGSACCPGCGGR